MFRRIHYKLANHIDVTDEQENDICTLQMKYLDLYDWGAQFPEFSKFDWYFNESSDYYFEEEFLSKLIEEPQKRSKILRKYAEKGKIHLREKDLIHGSVGILGNENNAEALVLFYIKVSEILDEWIYLHDEGDYLVCPILVKKDDAKPDKETIKKMLIWQTLLRKAGIKNLPLSDEKEKFYNLMLDIDDNSIYHYAVFTRKLKLSAIIDNDTMYHKEWYRDMDKKDLSIEELKQQIFEFLYDEAMKSEMFLGEKEINIFPFNAFRKSTK